jgi:hypothetical protein
MAMEGEVKAGAISGAAAILAASAALLLALPAFSHAQVPGRDADPVVLKGAELPGLLGANPAEIVGFRWTGAAWDQIPVQVDERADVPYVQTYNNATCAFTCSFTGLNEVYTDSGTWTGADPDPTLDAGDEIALMAKDSGLQGPGTGPAGVAPGDRIQLSLSDPISGAGGSFVYLYRSAGALDSSAGEAYVDYDFNLTSGDYKSTYLISDGPNPETSVVATPYYRHDGLTDRWFDTNLEVLGRGSTEADILDGEKHQFAPNYCGRSEVTFAGYAPDPAEGTFVINKSGPVRAIRSYYGANSGPFTQKTHVYYEQRSDTRVDLRVHAIPSVMTFLDFSPAAAGMIYRNPANPGGITIDGEPETPAASGAPAWEQVTGPQGTLDIVGRYTTDISPITIQHYWYDDSTPDSGHLQCSGDNAAYGSTGSWITSSLPTTDPRNAGFKNLSAVRTIYYDPPSQPASAAEGRAAQVDQPVEAAATTQPFQPVAEPPARTGKRAAALKKCKKIKKAKKAKRKKCVRKAKKRPL